MKQSAVLTRDFKDIRRSNGAAVGGKNASLGELVNALAPQGEFVRANGVRENIARLLAGWQAGRATLPETEDAIRKRFLWGGWLPDVEEAIRATYRQLAASEREDTRDGRDGHDGNGDGDVDFNADVAVRSSATAEDIPDGSFAGQLDSFLNVRGEEAVVQVCQRCYASLFTDRAISYRQTIGFDLVSIGLSVGVQRMVRSDIGGAGVLFSLDPVSGFDQVALINAVWGLGEKVVQGTVTPDEYHVFKPLLLAESRPDPNHWPALWRNGDEDDLHSGKAGRRGKRMHAQCAHVQGRARGDDAEHAQILQLARWESRPETVHSRRRDLDVFQRHKLVGPRGRELVRGLSVGDAAVSGRVCLIETADEIGQFVPGSVLVTGATDPDWVPIMKQAAAIVTDYGGRTSHAAIISRELGLPAVVGAGRASYMLHSDQEVTVSCAEGDAGFVYEGLSEIRTETIDLAILALPSPSPSSHSTHNSIQMHPMALVHFDELRDPEAKEKIARLTAGYRDKPAYFVDRLAHGFAALCAAVYPRPAILRLSDFKTNEYAGLIGASQFEEAFALECRAIKQLRQTIGFTNAVVMIPFCRTVDEARRVLSLMAENRLVRGQDGLQVSMMCEIPSNVILAAEFAEHFDGFSIGSNNLTQLKLGVDRASEELAHLFSEQDRAVRWMIAEVIAVDRPEFARFLVRAGIDSISVSPGSFVAVARNVQAAHSSGDSPA
ncbi:uncharacterized protein BDW70DRAFT_149680 [Aspergillus foveolatus]|uniref:uncharacterized protein n=1 Tax=Aspergillus foveolatus TaxID=210207 RepID=UPI003CCE335A